MRKPAIKSKGMSFYPIFLDIKNKQCLVVGGGSVAERKTLSLLLEGAKVTVVSPHLTNELKKLKKKKNIRHIQRGYKSKDLETPQRYFLVISAAGSKEVNKKVAKEAGKLDMLLNVVDNPGLSNFIVPSVVRRGALKIAISTSGKSPYMARKFRVILEKILPDEISTFIDLVGAVRNKLLKEKAKSGKKYKIYEGFLKSPILEWIMQGDKPRINAFLKGILGSNYTLSMRG